MSMVPYGRFYRSPRELSLFDMFDDVFPQVASKSTEAFQMNVEDKDDSYCVSALLPGVKREEIDVELNEGRLSISVDKKESKEDKDKNYVLKETSEWQATRGVYLKDAAVEGLSAKLVDGVLTVCVPKQEQKKNVAKITID